MLRGLVKVLKPNCSTAYKDFGKFMKINKANLNLIIDVFYNDGVNGILHFNVDNLYNFGVYIKQQGEKIELNLSVHQSFVLRDEIRKNVALDFIKRGKKVFNYLHPLYAIGDWQELVHSDDFTNEEVQLWNLTYESDIFWLNFYGPEIVKEIGIGKLDSVPYGKIEKLENGVEVPMPILPLPRTVKNGVEEALLPLVPEKAPVVVAPETVKIGSAVIHVVLALEMLAWPVTLSD